MKAKSNHAVRFFALCLAILLVCSVLIWGLASNWGKVDIKRITITGDDGSLISSLVYVPETATNENPAQVVMIFHGRSNHAHSNDTWSMELARRGYVVFSPDLSGGGQSDVNDRQAQAIALTKYVTTLNYVDCSNMTLVGYSAGCGTTAQVAMALPEYIKNVVQVMSPMLIHEINIDTPINWCIIKGQADQYNYEFVGDLEACRQRVTEYFNLPETVEYDKDYVVDKGTLRYNMATDFALHQTANVSADSIQYLVDYITYINPTDANTIANDDMVWGWHQIISGVACVTMMFFLASMINLLMQLDFFGKAANVVTLLPAQRGAKAWILDLVFTILIPALIFIHDVDDAHRAAQRVLFSEEVDAALGKGVADNAILLLNRYADLGCQSICGVKAWVCCRKCFRQQIRQIVHIGEHVGKGQLFPGLDIEIKGLAELLLADQAGILLSGLIEGDHPVIASGHIDVRQGVELQSAIPRHLLRRWAKGVFQHGLLIHPDLHVVGIQRSVQSVMALSVPIGAVPVRMPQGEDGIADGQEAAVYILHGELLRYGEIQWGWIWLYLGVKQRLQRLHGVDGQKAALVVAGMDGFPGGIGDRQGRSVAFGQA